MCRRTASVSWVLAVLFALACQKAAGPKAEPDVPEPEDLLVRVAVASPNDALARTKAYLEAVSPGSGATLEPRMLAQGLAFAVQTPQLDGLDLGKPLYLLILDPKKFARPVVIVGTVSDEAKLKAASNVVVEVKDGRAAVGEATAVQNVAAYGFSAAKLPAPTALTASLSPAKLITRYRAEIDEGRKNMAQVLSGQSPAMAKLLDTEIDLFVRLGDQSERLQVAVDVQGGEASFEVALLPRKGSTFEKFNAVQKSGVDPALLTRLPAVAKPSMIMVGRYDLGPARDAVIDLAGGAFEALAGKKLDAGLRAQLNDWFATFDGTMAMVSWASDGGAFQMAELFGATDGAKAAASGREVLAAVFGAPRDVEMMGMKMSFSAKAAFATHDGVAIDEYAVKLDLSSLPEMQREMMRKMYGEEGMHVYVAGFDKSFAVTMGSEGAQAMPKLIDAARKGGGAVPALATAPLAASAKRGSSMAMVIDYVQILAPMFGGAKPASTSGVGVDLGVADGAARLRLAVPAAHIKEITAMFGGAR